MNRKYLVFYQFENNGFGNTEIITHQIKSIDDIREIEKNITDAIGFYVSIINYKFIGFSFKKAK
jgi:hypothetical protein